MFLSTNSLLGISLSCLSSLSLAVPVVGEMGVSSGWKGAPPGWEVVILETAFVVAVTVPDTAAVTVRIQGAFSQWG